MKHTQKLNRIQRILKEKKAEKRERQYGEIYHTAHPTRQPLNAEETMSIFQALQTHGYPSGDEYWLWRLLLCGTPHESIKEYAIHCVEDESDQYLRGQAFLYVKQFFPTALPPLIDRYHQDPNPYIRYHIAETLPDRQQRIDTLRSILPDVGYDHALYDAIILEIGYGKIEKLSEVPQKDEATRTLIEEVGRL